MNPFPLCFMTDRGSLLSSQISRAGLCKLTSTPSPTSLLPLLFLGYLSCTSPGKTPEKKTVLAAQLLLQGGGLACFWWGNVEKEVAAKAGKGGHGDRWLCAQGAVPVWGTTCGKLHNSVLLSPRQSRVDYCCGHTMVAISFLC